MTPLESLRSRILLDEMSTEAKFHILEHEQLIRKHIYLVQLLKEKQKRAKQRLEELRTTQTYYAVDAKGVCLFEGDSVGILTSTETACKGTKGKVVKCKMANHRCMCTVRIKNRTAVKRLDNNLKKLNDDNIWELWVNKAMRDEVDYAIEALESI